MLDMGFAEDIEAILAETARARQTALFSATMPPRIESIARQLPERTDRIEIGRSRTRRRRGTAGPPEGVHRLPRPQTGRAGPGARRRSSRPRHRLLPDPGRSRPAHRNPQWARLSGRGAARRAEPGPARPRDADGSGGHRRPAIATDVAARGLDVEQLTHVVNYNVPADRGGVRAPHRPGRAGRPRRVAITLAEPREHRVLKNIEQRDQAAIQIATGPDGGRPADRRLEMTRAALRRGPGR